MPSGGRPDGNPQENLIAHYIELQKRYLEKIDELAAEQLAIEQAIETLDGTLRSLMRFRYIDGLVWEEVCVKMNYSWRQIHNLHGRALRELAKNTA
jgi:DNA-directed RNA polymerase specialized sigma24 family protein